MTRYPTLSMLGDLTMLLQLILLIVDDSEGRAPSDLPYWESPLVGGEAPIVGREVPASTLPLTAIPR